MQLTACETSSLLTLVVVHSLAVLLPPAVLAALPAGGKEGDDAQAVVLCGLTRILLLCLCLQGGTFSLQDVDSEE